MEPATAIPRCDWRRHSFSEAPCGHLYCVICASDQQQGKAPCTFCDDMWDAADELLNHERASEL